MTLTPEQRAKLNANLPPEKVKQREAGKDRNGQVRWVSYVDGFDVIDTLNEILGSAGWGYRATVRQVWDGMDDKGRFCVAYLGSCVLTVGDCVIEDVGAGHGIDYNPGQAHESASKEAATDALKRCAKSLGRRMGLALYDKQQTHVGEEPAPLSAKATQIIQAVKVATSKLEKDNVLASYETAWDTLTPADRQAIDAAIEARRAARKP